MVGAGTRPLKLEIKKNPKNFEMIPSIHAYNTYIPTFTFQVNANANKIYVEYGKVFTRKHSCQSLPWTLARHIPICSLSKFGFL